MTQNLRSYLYGGRYLKKTLLVPGGTAVSLQIGKSYQLEGIGRGQLVKIETADHRTITNRNEIVPSRQVRLFTVRLSNGKEITAAPKQETNQARSAAAGYRSSTIGIVLGGNRGVWLR